MPVLFDPEIALQEICRSYMLTRVQNTCVCRHALQHWIQCKILEIVSHPQPGWCFMVLCTSDGILLGAEGPSSSLGLWLSVEDAFFPGTTPKCKRGGGRAPQMDEPENFLFRTYPSASPELCACVAHSKTKTKRIRRERNSADTSVEAAPSPRTG